MINLSAPQRKQPYGADLALYAAFVGASSSAASVMRS